MHLSKITLDSTEDVFDIYQHVRGRLPSAVFPQESRHISSISDILDDFDVFLFDAFGILNVGDRAIPGAAEMLAMLTDAGKHIYIVTNGASFTRRQTLEKYRSLGFDLGESSMVSSRDTMLRDCCLEEKTVGLISGCRETGDLACKVYFADEPEFDEADVFIFADSAGWDVMKQTLWMQVLKKRPRPVLVANPDITAPRGDCYSAEPGYFTLAADDDIFSHMEFFGKPFNGIFRYALEKIHCETGCVDKSRILMTGDTLHTDILGGAAAGLKTLLVSSYGFFAGLEPAPFIRQSGIVPDYILESYG